MMDHCTRIFLLYFYFSVKGAGLSWIDGVKRDWSLGRGYHESVFVIYTRDLLILNQEMIYILSQTRVVSNIPC
jgi:hypothetical protein